MAYSVSASPLELLSEMLPEIYIVEKFDFLKSMIHSQII